MDEEEDEGRENFGMITSDSGNDVAFLHMSVAESKEQSLALITDTSIMTPQRSMTSFTR